MKQLKKTLPLFLLVITALLSGCDTKSGGSGDTSTSTTPKDTTPKAPTAAVAQDDTTWMQKDGLYAVIATNKGKMVCELEYTKAPMTVGNFVALAEGKHPLTTVRKGQPYFDGLTYHRVEPGFVIQGGDPAGNGSGGQGYQFPNEADPSLLHSKAGTLAMANAGPGTNGSQFYITLAPTPQLDGGGKYTVFGYIVSGQAAVNATVIGDKMDSVRIVRVGKDAAAFDAVAAFTAKYKLANAPWEDKVKAKYPTAKKTASGLYYVIDKKGTGVYAKAGQTVSVNYTGTLWNGQKFDSNLDHGGKPFEFPLGQHRVIQGWDEGFALFNVGSKGKLIIPSKLGYGEQGTPGGPIPPNADLVFDIEMLGVK